MESQTQDQPRVLATCASCGRDPGGILFEGFVLTGFLRADDIVTILRGALDRRQVVKLFTRRILHGTQPTGRQWFIRASQFVADWEHFEQRTKIALKAARPRSLEVAGRG
jgi:hypothetical protein